MSGKKQRALVRREADAVGLVERVGDADHAGRTWVVLATRRPEGSGRGRKP